MPLVEALKTYRLQLLLALSLLAGLYYTIIPEMVQQWYNDDNYSHGFIIPLISGWFLYTRWDSLKKALVEPWGPGLLIIIFGLIQLTVGWLCTEYFTMRSSLVVLLAGMTLYLLGKGVFRRALLPLAYLLFMVPIPYIVYDAAAFPLKLFITKVSVWVLKAAGIVVWREGNILMFPEVTFEVADACSGTRSLMSLLALGVAYAIISQRSNLKRWILVLATIPIAIFTNALRVIVTGILAQWWGAKAAEGFFHEFAGMAVFALAMLLLVALGTLLARGEKKAGDTTQ
ncbi:MAG: exosortase/archaeosortase family protein [Deltaproteobacteria bacterium]|nr:exosortase/archaeosortase family protein [Deltaproteobacteria bacterium]TLN01635.1 MAG: exosortase/archaeosortase family protein [bacterium]